MSVQPSSCLVEENTVSRPSFSLADNESKCVTNVILDNIGLVGCFRALMHCRHLRPSSRQGQVEYFGIFTINICCLSVFFHSPNRALTPHSATHTHSVTLSLAVLWAIPSSPLHRSSMRPYTRIPTHVHRGYKYQLINGRAPVPFLPKPISVGQRWGSRQSVAQVREWP